MFDGLPLTCLGKVRYVAYLSISNSKVVAMKPFSNHGLFLEHNLPVGAERQEERSVSSLGGPLLCK